MSATLRLNQEGKPRSS